MNKKIISTILATSLLLGSFSLLLPRSTFATGETTQVESAPTKVELNQYSLSEEKNLFDYNWKFNLGDVVGAMNNAFDDTSWQIVNLPHDYSLSQDYSQFGEGESGYKLGGVGWYRKTFTLDQALREKEIFVHFDGAYMQADVYLNGQKLAFHPYGYTAFSVRLTDYINWNAPNVLAVRTNHEFPSSRWYSGSGLYRSVHLYAKPLAQIMEYGVKFETPDLATMASSPEGATVKITTKLENRSASNVSRKLRFTLKERNRDGSEGPLLATYTTEGPITIDAAAKVNNVVEFKAVNPKLWSIETPNLYYLKTEVLGEADAILQTDTQEVGFRYFAFDRDTGFSLNGTKLKLQGVCLHHDQGALGAAAYSDAILRQVQILKEMGTNSIRVTHNPSAKALRDAANREGILLIDEAFDTWHYAKNSNPHDFAKWFNRPVGSHLGLTGITSTTMTWGEYETKQMVRAALNDPSVFMWSTGNEVMEGMANHAGLSNYPQVVTQIADWMDEIDGTRPITIGDNKLKNGNGNSVGMADALTSRNRDGRIGGIVGYNYASHQYNTGHNNGKNWFIYGSETASAVTSRGIYDHNGMRKRANKLLTSFDDSAVGWGATASNAWYDVITRDYVFGEYVWTGFDYLGEPTPWNGIGRYSPTSQEGAWPAPKSSYFGIIDTAGLPKDSFYFYKSQWDKNATTLHILPTWNRENIIVKNDGNVEVVVYSNAKAVELFLTPNNGQRRSLGKKEFTTVEGIYPYQIYRGADKKTPEHKNLSLYWNVPYQEGKIEAVAYDAQGTVIANTVGRSEVYTHGTPHHLELSSKKQQYSVNPQSLAYVEISVQDTNNHEVSNAAIPVSVEVEGPAELVGLDNGHQADHTPYSNTTRNTLSGKMIAILRFTGKTGDVQVRASSSGVSPASLTLSATASSNTEVGTSTNKKAIAYTIKKNIYIAKGNRPVLPSSVLVHYDDETEANLPVTWEDTNLDQRLSSEKVVTLNGRVAGVDQPVILYITPIEKPAAIKNISKAVLANSTLTLPTTVQAYLIDGKLIESTFPVVWEEYDRTKLATPQTFIVNGKANVLGVEMPVTASIRVAEHSVVLGDNVAPSAVRLTQDVPEGSQTDNLNAVNDRRRTKSDNVSGGSNQTVWSNFNYSQANEANKKSKIEFTYDTAQAFYEAIIVTAQDTYASRHPKEVRIFADDQEVTDITVVETRNIDANTKLTKYRFPSVKSALKLGVEFTNADQSPRADTKACVLITEIELYVANEVLAQNSLAYLENLSIEDEEISEAQWVDDNVIETEMTEPTIEANATESNGAVTILPPYEGHIKIFITSEDGQTTSEYRILLDTRSDKSANDGSADIDHDDVSVEASSAQPGDNTKADNANDGDPETIWHSRWRGGRNPRGDEPIDNLYFDITLDNPTLIEALRYLPRPGTVSGSENGRVKRFKVLVKSSANDQEWREVATGNWENSPEWKMATFEPIMAKIVRLKAEEVYSSDGKNYMSAAEVSLRENKPKKPLTEANVTTTFDAEGYELVSTGTEVPATTIVVRDGDKILKKGVHYKLVYEDNTSVRDDAKVKIVGISEYEGEISKTFKIKARDGEEVASVPRLEFVDPTKAPQNYTLVVDTVDYTNKNDVRLQNVDEYEVFDIYIKNSTTDERIAYPSEEVFGKSKLTLLKGKSKDILKVLYLNPDKTSKEEIRILAQDERTVQIELSHLSEYALLYSEATENGETDNGETDPQPQPQPQPPIPPQPPVVPNKPEVAPKGEKGMTDKAIYDFDKLFNEYISGGKEVKKEKKDHQPQTGTKNINVILIAMILSLATVVMSKLRKNN